MVTRSINNKLVPFRLKGLSDLNSLGLALLFHLSFGFVRDNTYTPHTEMSNQFTAKPNILATNIPNSNNSIISPSHNSLSITHTTNIMNDLRSQQLFLVKDNDHNLPYFDHTNERCLHQYHSCQQLNRWNTTVVAFIVPNNATGHG
jgi:hypothetical protein